MVESQTPRNEESKNQLQAQKDNSKPMPRKTIAHAQSVDEQVFSRRFDQKPTLFKTDRSSDVQDPGELEQVETMWDKVFGAMVEKGKLIALI